MTTANATEPPHPSDCPVQRGVLKAGSRVALASLSRVLLLWPGLLLWESLLLWPR